MTARVHGRSGSDEEAAQRLDKAFSALAERPNPSAESRGRGLRAQLRATAESAASAGSPGIAERAVNLLANEIAVRCGDEYRDALDAWSSGNTH